MEDGANINVEELLPPKWNNDCNKDSWHTTASSVATQLQLFWYYWISYFTF